MMQKIAAVYCVYENSGFLAESVRRVYPLMDKILFLLNFKPWNGQGDYKIIEQTYSDILKMYDPHHKIEIVSGYWKSEADQRNYGLKRCRDSGIQWNFIIDDDEMYNYSDLKNQINEKVFNQDFSVYLSPHQVYWKDSNHCISNIVAALPSFASTEQGLLYFNEARAIITRGKWHTFYPNDLICHHYSYVRNDQSMLRKIRTFSHADPSMETWYQDIWLKWDENMEDLHPNQANPASFKKAIHINDSKYQLEECRIYPDSFLEKFLKNIECLKTPFDLNWLKWFEPTKFLIDTVFNFTYSLAEQKNINILELGTKQGQLYYTMCEAILKSKSDSKISSYSEHPLKETNKTYESFSKNALGFDEEYDLIHIAREVSPVDVKISLSKLKKGGFVFISNTQTDNKKLFEEYRKDKAYFEFKENFGFAIVQEIM